MFYVLGFSGSDGHNLSANEAERRGGQDAPVSQESSFGTFNIHELDEGSGVVPVAESEPIVSWATSKVDDDPKDQKSDDCQDLDLCRKRRLARVRMRATGRNLLNQRRIPPLRKHQPPIS